MICLDANIVLEIIFKRQNAAICRTFVETDNEDKAITTLTLDLVMYFAEKHKLPWQSIKSYLEAFAWLPLTQSDAGWAFGNFYGKDFEDALQVGCALREGCQRFVTLDRDLAKKYKDEINIDLLA